jgi:cell wall-associated NlpC family hydrolase
LPLFAIGTQLSGHRLSGRGRLFALAAGTAMTLGLGLVQATPAGAAPTPPAQPTTSADAKKAWIDASQRAEAVNELVLQAKIAEKAATTKAAKADLKVRATRRAAAKAAAAVKQADSTVAGYQTKIDDFANASFRGARLSQLSLLLTASSADDFLDSASALDQVADDTQHTLDNALAARATARQARIDAVAAADAAVRAQSDADVAKAAATEKTAQVKARQADLTVKVADFKKLYNQLTAKERQEAIEAAERARAAEAARLQAEAEAAAEAQRQADEAAAAQAAAAQAAAEAAAATPAAEPAPRADRGEARSTPASSTAAASSKASATKTAAPSSAPATPEPSSQAQVAVQAALSRVGMAYVYGAAGPTAFDCSGLVMWAWAQAGVSLPHSSAADAGYPSVSLDQLQPGDLVTYYSPVSHVAMYIGNGQVVHASTESRPVMVTGLYEAGPSPSGHRVLG